MTNKLSKIINYTKEHNLDGVLLTSMPNVFYVSGFTGDNVILFISPEKALLITDSRYTLQAEEQSPDFQVVTAKGSLVKELKDLKLKKLGFEADRVTCAQLDAFKKTLEGCEFEDASAFMNEIRIIKAAEEIDLIRIAAQIADDAFAHIIKFAKVGMTEREIALELEFFMRKNGAESVSFDTIVAAGDHGAMPHAEPSDRVIKDGDCVVMDFGCKYKGYCSDMTRTVFFGKADERQLEVYNSVLNAQKAALAQIKAGVCENAPDKAAREELAKSNLDKYFTHSLGHGVGVEIHEDPRMAPKCTGALKENMLVTVEPGVYIDGFMGVRIEDLVVVTADGYENLTKSEKDVIIL